MKTENTHTHKKNNPQCTFHLLYFNFPRWFYFLPIYFKSRSQEVRMHNKKCCNTNIMALSLGSESRQDRNILLILIVIRGPVH